MYEEVFDLESRPFVSAPFVKHYFATQSMSHTMAQAQLCIDRAAGPVVVVGGAGTGKSLFLTMLAEQYADQFNVVNLACARLAQRSDLLQNILFELEQPYRDMTEGELRLALIDFLKPSDLCPNGVLLLVDEAQVLDANLLDEVRLITNFVRDGQPRVRLVMAGTHELEDALTNPKLESFNQRIAARCYLSNLSYEDTIAYVRSHIDRAGGRGEELVPDNSIRVLFEVTDGCPRLINQVCDQALMLAALNNQSLLTEQCLQEAWRDVQIMPGAWANRTSATSTPDTLQPEVDSEQWSVLEFGQLDDNATADVMPDLDSEMTVERKHSAAGDHVNEDDQHNLECPCDDVGVDAQTHDNLNDIAAPLVAQITEFARRYGTPQSVVAEDGIVEPLNEQIAEFQQRYGTSAVADTPAAFEAFADHDDIAIPLGAQVAELNMRSHLMESSLANDILAVSGEHSSEQDFEDSEFTNDSEKTSAGDSTPAAKLANDTAALPSHEEFESADNPFDEPFEQEELLIDRFLPIVAEQNRSSLCVTADDLETICRPQKHISLAELQADLLGENSLATDAAAHGAPDVSETILRELKHQHQEMKVAVEMDRSDEQEPDDDEITALAIEFPVAQHESRQAEDDVAVRRDDRDMIVISRADELSSPQQTERAENELMPRHISTGRAERKEYQELFDQLRDVRRED